MATDIDHPSRARVLHAAARDPKDLDAPVRLVLNGRAPDIEVGLSHPGMSTIVAKLRRHADGRVTLDDMSHAIARVWKSVDEQVERLHATSRGPLKKFLASVIAAGRDKSRPLEKRPGPGGGEGWGPHPPAKGAIDEEPR